MKELVKASEKAGAAAAGHLYLESCIFESELRAGVEFLELFCHSPFAMPSARRSRSMRPSIPKASGVGRCWTESEP